MKAILEKVDGACVLELSTDHLDASNVKEFKAQVTQLLDASPRLIVDLSRVKFVDSAGCGAVLSAVRKAAAAGGDVKLCGVTKPVRALFELVRMHKVVDILNSREEAVRAFAAYPAAEQQ